MEKIKRIKCIWLAAMTASMALGVAAIAGMVIFSLKLLYIPFVLSMIFAAHGFYGTPFYFIAYSNMKLTEKAAEAIECKGMTETGEIAECLNIKETFCEKLLIKAKKRNYISNFRESKSEQTITS